MLWRLSYVTVNVNTRQTTDRRQELLEAAEELLRSAGPHALSLRDIAERSGTSTQAVYTEFGGKPGLADALYREGYRRLAENLAAVSAELPPVERIRELCFAYRDTALANPHFYELMSGRPIPEYDPPTESRREAAATFDVLIDAIQAAVDAGELHVQSPRELAGLLWTAGHGYVSLTLHGLLPEDRSQGDRLADIILREFMPDQG